jgi:hypothetical protein
VARRWRKRLVLAALATLLVLAGAWFTLQLIVGPIVRGKLESLAQMHLHASLRIGGLTYLPPYTLRLRDVRLVRRNGRSAELAIVQIPQIELTLAQLPARHAPLDIEKVDLTEPTLRIAHAPASTPTTDAARLPEHTSPAISPASQPAAPPKLSSLFRLRRLIVSRGSLVFVDQSDPARAALILPGIDLDLGLELQASALYRLTVAARQGSVSDLVARGAIDIDGLSIVLDQLAFSANVQPQPGEPNDPLQKLIRAYDVRGRVQIEGSGRARLRDLGAAEFESTITICSASARLGESQLPLEHVEAKLSCTRQQDGIVTMHSKRFSAASANAVLRLDRLQATLDLGTRAWRLADVAGNIIITGAQAARFIELPGKVRLAAGSIGFSGSVGQSRESSRIAATLRDVSLLPPRFTLPIEHVDGEVRLENGAFQFAQFTGRYGNDQWNIAGASIPAVELDKAVRVNDVVAKVTFNQPATPYPGALRAAVESLVPGGEFSLRGQYAYNRAMTGLRQTFDLAVSTQDGTFAPTRWKVPVTRVRGEASISPDRIAVQNLLARVLGGALSATATIDPRQPISFSTDIVLEDFDLAQVVKVLPVEGVTGVEMSGNGNASISLRSDSPNLDSMRGSGEIELLNARLWQGRVLAYVVKEIKLAEELLNTSESAAVFTIGEGRLNVKSVALSSAALGVHGSGSVGLDGSLDLRLTAVPMGDLEARFKQLRIPIVGDAIAMTVGGMEKVVNLAAERLLYEFHVTGKMSDPKVAPIAAPILTEAAAEFFGRILHKREGVQGAIRGTKPDSGR